MLSDAENLPAAKVCFVSLNSSQLLFRGERDNFMGGAELQQFLIGRELAERGYKIAFLTRAPEDEATAAGHGFEVITSFRQGAGVPILRFFYPRLFKICRALLQADADIYYVRGASFVLAPVVFLARLKQRKVVFCGAYDPDFSPQAIQLPSNKDRWLFFWGLKRVDAVIVQNRIQQQLARENFNRSAEVIHNCYPATEVLSSAQEGALWVGNFRDTKNPEAYLELARSLPDYPFTMIGGKPGQRDYAKISQAAAEIDNLNFLGFLPLNETESYFSKIRVFVNTSTYEGFPNTFLQAWSRGVPVVSYVDPDGLIEKHQLGVVVKSPVEMVNRVREILAGELNFSAEKIQQYFIARHGVERISDQYERLFADLLRKSPEAAKQVL